LLNWRQAAALIPPFKGDTPVSAKTVWRWTVEGVRGEDGKVVRLATVQVGNRTMISLRRVSEFVSSLTAAASQSQAECSRSLARYPPPIPAPSPLPLG